MRAFGTFLLGALVGAAIVFAIFWARPDWAERVFGEETRIEVNQDQDQQEDREETVTGEVREVITPRAFTVETEDRGTLLVVARDPLETPVTVGNSVRVSGEIRDFDRDDVERTTGLALDAEIFARFTGDEVILAESIAILAQAQ